MCTLLSTVESSTVIFKCLFWEPFMRVQVHLGSKVWAVASCNGRVYSLAKRTTLIKSRLWCWISSLGFQKSLLEYLHVLAFHINSFYFSLSVIFFCLVTWESVLYKQNQHSFVFWRCRFESRLFLSRSVTLNQPASQGLRILHC